MKIYFACSITGGRDDEGVYQRLVQWMEAEGYHVPTAHIAQSGIEIMDAAEEARDIYRRDVTWIDESDLLVAEVSTPSHGVGYEIGYALAREKPVFCLFKEEIKVSKMILGNPHPLLELAPYRDQAHAVELLVRYLQKTDHP